MLADPRANALVTNFAFQWLKVDEHGQDQAGPEPVPGLRRGPARGLPQGDGAVRRQRAAARTSRVTDLLTANYTFLNERLALHYGIPNVRGEQFRRVDAHRPASLGLLGKGAF